MWRKTEDGRNISRLPSLGRLGSLGPGREMFISRYLQEVSVENYAISKSIGDNQIVYTNTWTESMVSIVNVSGTTNPASGIPVNFTISTSPVGSTGQSLNKSSETTNKQGLADVQLRLGDIPAEYGVLAACPACVPEQNSVTFTCCGKLQTDDFKQFDVRWKNEHYDNICSTEPSGTGRYRPVYSCNDPIFNRTEYRNKKYKFSISAKGCALTAMASLINYYKEAYNLPISSTTPKDLNKFFLSTTYINKTDKCYTEKGGVSFECVKKYSSNILLSENLNITKKIKRSELINKVTIDINKKLPVILKISNPTHFILAVGKCGNKFIVSDPGSSQLVLYNPDVGRPLIGIRRFKYVP